MDELNDSIAASACGGCSSSNDLSQPIVTSINEPSNTPTPLFSQVLKTKSKTVYPRKDQAIILNSIDGVPIKDYIVSLGKAVQPKNILFASRISNNRVCIYLTSKDIVTKFMTDHGGITIGDIFISSRRLITPARRVILSGVSPCIPHEVIEQVLQENNVKTVSPVSYVGVGLGLPEYSHVYSFRRQVFIVPDDSVSLPSSLIVNFDEDSFRIFLATDELRCFSCKEVGHISKNCPQGIPNKNTSPETTPSNEDSTKVASSAATEQPKNDFIAQNVEAPKGLKRMASQTLEKGNSIENLPSVISDTQSDKEVGNRQQITRQSKKKKPDTVEAYEPLKPIFAQKQQILDYDDFIKFMSAVKGKDNAHAIAQEFTPEIPKLISLLIEAHPLIELRSLRERMKRLSVSLSKGPKLNDDFSDNSTDSCY